MYKCSILFLGLSLLFTCQPAPPPPTEDPSIALSDSLRSQIQALHDQGWINGFGTAIVHKDQVVFQEGFGFADVEKQTPYTASTIQNIGSVSKTFIGLALLKAQELGKLNLDDPINDHLPFEVNHPKHPDAVITIRHLATHTGTILDTDTYNGKAYILVDDLPDLNADSLQISETLNPRESAVSLIDFLEQLLSEGGDLYNPAGFSEDLPGAIYEYTNIGAALAGAVLEQATGQSFADFTAQHILQPLGMASAGFTFDSIDRSKHSTLYSNPETAIPFYRLITYPDGGILTSISDLGIYLNELIKGYSGRGTLLANASYAELFKEQLSALHFPDRDSTDAYDDEFNTGIFMGFTPAGYVGHTGGDPGIACFLFFDPKTQSGRCMMINTSIINQAGVDQFFSIWGALGEYERRW
ncbi:MAG: serine hydrolase domain-containing protein [Bacteroidota bacterium]